MSGFAVVDYKAGNLTSVLKALRAAGAAPAVTSDPNVIAGAAAIVIPGVGHFGATAAIDDPMRQAIVTSVRNGAPLLGICLGLQFLFQGSSEAPGVPGLGLLPGTCTRLNGDVKVPHVGWNTLAVRPSRLLREVNDSAHVYFTHSYAAPVTDATIATTEHGETFAAAVERDNVFGVQFHPEKSSETGLQILRTFVQISKFPKFQISKC